VGNQSLASIRQTALLLFIAENAGNPINGIPWIMAEIMILINPFSLNTEN
jgi:hypothetical protein